MMTVKRLMLGFTAVMLIVMLAGCSRSNVILVPSAPIPVEAAKAKNVILFIGDGMGLAHVEATTYYMYGQTLDENMNPPRLSFVKFPVFGYLTTHSSNSLVTDSAAAGTALASGVKTLNGAVGMDSEGRPFPSIAVLAKEMGKSVAVLSSVGLNHATPAAFYAHNTSRSNYDDLLDQAFAAKHVDVLIGGGVYGKGDLSKEAMKRRAEQNGVVYFDLDNLAMLTPEFTRGHRVIGAFDANDNKQLDYEAKREANHPEPHLSDLTLLALDLIDDNPNGFFMMVEGGAIDWAGHANDIENVVGETMEFDRAITRVVKALEAKGNLNETLIIVTADHETGGLCITGPYNNPQSADHPMESGFVSTNHTAIPVPVYAHGPGSRALRGKHDNTAVYRAMKAAMD